MPATPKHVDLLKDKKVVIIGGSSGIGFGVASALVELGAHVTISSSNADRVNAAVKRLTDSETQYGADSSRVAGEVADLSGQDAEAKLIALFDKVGVIDHLVYTAGDALAIRPLDQHNYQTIIAAGQLRFIAAVLAVKAARPHIRSGGSIVLTTGSVCRNPRPNWAVVNGFAEGLVGLTRGLALDLSAHNIRVNLVSPGAVKTELWNFLSAEAFAQVEKQTSEKVLTRKMGEVEEVARAYIYLMTDTNVTGETVYTDAGACYGPAPAPSSSSK